MTQSRSVCSRIRNARASLDNAERSFRSNQEVRFLDPSYAGGLFCCSGAGLRMFGLVVGFCVWRKHYKRRRITGIDNCR